MITGEDKLRAKQEASEEGDVWLTPGELKISDEDKIKMDDFLGIPHGSTDSEHWFVEYTSHDWMFNSTTAEIYSSEKEAQIRMAELQERGQQVILRHP